MKFAAAGYATNFSGNFETEVSRYYWDRMHFRGVSVPDEFFAATHSAIQGAPTYSSDPGGYAQEALALFDISDTPDDWLDGYTPAADIEGSEAFDRWMRDLAQSQGVPIPDVADYQFENLVDEDQGGEQFGT